MLRRIQSILREPAVDYELRNVIAMSVAARLLTLPEAARYLGSPRAIEIQPRGP